MLPDYRNNKLSDNDNNNNINRICSICLKNLKQILIQELIHWKTAENQMFYPLREGSLSINADHRLYMDDSENSYLMSLRMVLEKRYVK